MTGRQYRKNIARAMVWNAQERFDTSIDSPNWSDARDCQFIYFREISRMFGMNVEHVFAIAEYADATENDMEGCSDNPREYGH
jgi:hypothetical protein